MNDSIHYISNLWSKDYFIAPSNCFKLIKKHIYTYGVYIYILIYAEIAFRLFLAISVERVTDRKNNLSKDMYIENRHKETTVQLCNWK